MSSHTISAVHEASASTWLTAPKRVLSWWWSMLRIGAPLGTEVDRVAVDVAAVQEDVDALAERPRAARRRALEVEEAVLVGQRELVGVDVHHRVLAQGDEHRLHGDERAQRVAVGVLVGDEQEAVVLADLLEHAVAAGQDGVRRSPSPSEDLGDAHARVDRRVVGELSVGVCLRRSSWATRRCRKPWAERKPARLASRSSSVPSTETNTRACRRSGLVFTAVTVTNPTRGSLRSCVTASLKTALTASSTRRILSEAMLPPKVLDRSHVALETCPVRMTVEHEALHPVQCALELVQRAGGQRGRQRGPLPEVLVVDLGHRRAETPAGSGPSASDSSLRFPLRSPTSGKCRWTSRRATKAGVAVPGDGG